MSRLALIISICILCLAPPAATASVVPQIKAGDYHTVALMSDGTVRTWGYNEYGQLGDGTISNSSAPLTVTGLGGAVTAIAAGSNHTVTLMSDGSVKTWGDNNSGQLGNNCNINSSTPVSVTGLGGTVTAIDAGVYHTVALMSDGTVKAWGNNGYGQLGDGTSIHSSTPVTVTGLGGTVTAIAAGDYHTVALMSDGTVKTWGYNSFGQLGNGTAGNSCSPVTVTGLVGTVTAIAAGDCYTVALMSDGILKTWGSNAYGQLGDGTISNSSTPVTVKGLAGSVTAIAAGGCYVVALVADGTLQAWGYNKNGQLGNGSTTDSNIPVVVSDLAGTVTAIAAGWCHTVALMSDGTVKAWGYNGDGQIGNGTIKSSTPVTVTGLVGTTSIVAGSWHTLALFSDGTVKAWGDNGSGQLGNGFTFNGSTPMTVIGLEGAVTAITAGSWHSVALMFDGSVKTWGENSYGQLGNNSNINSSTPVSVIEMGGTVTAIAAGVYHTVALISDGTVKAWGNNGYGQLGDGTTIHSSTPVTVTGLGGTVMAIAAGDYHTVALMSDGTVKTWGYNEHGQLGDGTSSNSSSPVTVIGLTKTVTTIAAGSGHSVANMSDGFVKTWGYNGDGQLGNGTTTNSNTPVMVTGLEGVATTVAAGRWHNVALMSDGTVKAWGGNDTGQLGNDTTVSSSNPVTVTGLVGTVSAVTAGESHTAALMSEGTVKAWGNNSFGQLGNQMSVYKPVTALINLDVTAPITANDLPGGIYGSSQTVHLTCSDNFSGCSGIYYSDDNSNPTAASYLYTGPITISSNTTLKFMALDNAGNQSDTQSLTYTIVPNTSTLTTFFLGNGSGSVIYSTGDSCTTIGGCSLSFRTGETVSLTPMANQGSVFSDWDNCPSRLGDLCTTVVDMATSVTAFFNLIAGTSIKVGDQFYGTVSSAVGAVSDNGEISIQTGSLYEVLNFNQPISATLNGGYDGYFTKITGVTTLHGSITITAGTLRVRGIIIQ
jgi:alpha-tubulin suppressor-like RCC1 family protein